MEEEVFNPKWLQRAKRIEMAGKIFNPKMPQRGKRIETAGKIFNPKVPQRGKRIEREEEALNPKWFQKAEWIEHLVSVWKKYALAGAGAWASRDDGSLPPFGVHLGCRGNRCFVYETMNNE